MIQVWHHKRDRYVLIFLIIILIAPSAKGQFKEDAADSFSAGFSQEINGLIKGRNILSGQYVHGRRTFELGLLLSRYERVAGFVFKHQYFLNRNRNKDEYQIADYGIRPFLIYQFVYNQDIPETFLRQDLSGDSFFMGPTPQQTPSMMSIEHYLGFGAEVNITRSMYLNAYAGGGLYFYRNNVRVVSEGEGVLPQQLTDFTWNISLGMGFRFN
jgi:hypothetical protein